MSAADYRDNIELPGNLITEIESCRRLVLHPKADKAAMFEIGATAVFRVADKDDREVWQVAVDTLYEIADGVGLAADPAQAILDIAYKKSFELPAETDPIILAWEANDPRNKAQANGRDAEPTPEPDAYGTTTTQLPATIGRPTRELKLNDPADYAGKEIPPREWLALHAPANPPKVQHRSSNSVPLLLKPSMLPTLAHPRCTRWTQHRPHVAGKPRNIARRAPMPVQRHSASRTARLPACCFMGGRSDDSSAASKTLYRRIHCFRS